MFEMKTNKEQLCVLLCVLVSDKLNHAAPISYRPLAYCVAALLKQTVCVIINLLVLNTNMQTFSIACPQQLMAFALQPSSGNETFGPPCGSSPKGLRRLGDHVTRGGRPIKVQPTTQGGRLVAKGFIY
jgi:hypothetical protein